jgi:hypothetical protein
MKYPGGINFRPPTLFLPTLLLTLATAGCGSGHPPAIAAATTTFPATTIAAATTTFPATTIAAATTTFPATTTTAATTAYGCTISNPAGMALFTSEAKAIVQKSETAILNADASRDLLGAFAINEGNSKIDVADAMAEGHAKVVLEQSALVKADLTRACLRQAGSMS